MTVYKFLFIYFQNGLYPQIPENKEIHNDLYENRRVKLMWVGILHVVSIFH